VATEAGRRRRVLLVTRNLPPLVGGMERLNWNMAHLLGEVADIRVIAPHGSAAMAPLLDVREVAATPLWKFLWRAMRAAAEEAKSWRPDVVLAGSGLTAPLALAAARTCRAKAVAYVHGLDVAIRHPIYRALWLPALRRMDRLIANSRATAALCDRIRVASARVGIVHPGVELPTAGHEEAAVASFRAAHALGDRPLLLSVGRLTTRKGLLEFVTRALPRIVESRPDVLLVVVGEAPSEALHAGVQTPDSISKAARELGLAEHLRFLGVETDYGRLGVIYRAAQVHVFPVRDLQGDPEGFGMVAVEAAAHGLPTVAFATGGVVDAVSDGVSGRLVYPGDYRGLADAVLDTLRASDGWSHQCMNFAARFAWDEFGRLMARQLEIPAAAATKGLPA